VPARQAIGQALGVFVGLDFDAGEGDALFLGFDHPGSLAVDIQQVIGETVAGFQRELTDGNAPRGVDICLARVAHMPAGYSEQAIDVLPGFQL
jgi:hypothetical protein